MTSPFLSRPARSEAEAMADVATHTAEMMRANTRRRPRMTRDQAIMIIARQIASDQGAQWQRHPNAAQERAQTRREQQATRIVEMIEAAMLDFRWSAE